MYSMFVSVLRCRDVYGFLTPESLFLNTRLRALMSLSVAKALSSDLKKVVTLYFCNV